MKIDTLTLPASNSMLEQSYFNYPDIARGILKYSWNAQGTDTTYRPQVVYNRFVQSANSTRT